MIKNFADFLNENREPMGFQFMEQGDFEEGLMNHKRVHEFFGTWDLCVLNDDDENDDAIYIKDRIEKILAETNPKYSTSTVAPKDGDFELCQYYNDPFEGLDKLVKVDFRQTYQGDDSHHKVHYQNVISYIISNDSLSKLLQLWKGRMTGKKYGLNESEAQMPYSNEKDHSPTAVLRKSLDDLGKGFDEESSIIKAIQDLGFKYVKTGKERTADYVFDNPENGQRYISNTTGYVRSNIKGTSWRSSMKIIRKTPITKAMLPNVKDRLLLILRVALKSNDLYHMWKKSKLTVNDFLVQKKGMIMGKKFGI